MHQQQFSNPISFWTGAVKTTPNSAYANMMLAARIHEIDPTRGDQLMRNAHQLNPNEKYVNYYLGKVFLEKNNIDSAERYLLAELKGSAYFDTYFLMSRVVLEKGDSLASLNYMQTYLEKDPGNSQAMNNYILLLCQTNQYDRAKTFIRKKQQEQIAVPKALVDLVNGVLSK
jgi:predicted Zn-dependent protease